MNDDLFAAIPAERRDAARAAIAAVFGSAAIARVRPVTGGVSGALVFLVENARHRLVLRMEGPPGPLRNPHQYAAMRIAAKAGIAPRIRHLDERDRIVMMDFIEDRPLETFPGGSRGLATAAGAMLRQLQALPRFPHFMDYPDLVQRVWAHVCRTGLFARACWTKPRNGSPTSAGRSGLIGKATLPATTISCRATCCSTANGFG